MKELLLKSFVFSVFSCLLMYFIRVVFHTETLLADVGGISAFATIFGTLFGILAAFVVVEVWSQYSTTQGLVEKEALGLEKLFSLALYFRDDGLSQKMKKAIKKYIDLATSSFEELGKGKRLRESSKSFRDISKIIREVKFDDEHDQIVFDHIIDHYRQLSQIRADRINQSLQRLPIILKGFLFIASLIGLLTFLFMPFTSLFYAIFTAGSLAFILAMVYQLVEDLDNPFDGYWNITPEPFERALRHIEEDY